jgi:pimeloyl-CoA synthetase
MTYNRKNGAEASETEYKDYWTGYVGRHEIHYFRGMRVTNGGTTSDRACWITQASKY